MGKSITNTLRDLVGDVADDLKEAFDEILEHDKHRRGPRHHHRDRDDRWDRGWDRGDRWDRDCDWDRHRHPGWDRDRGRDHDRDRDRDRRPIDELTERMDALIGLLRDRRADDAQQDDARGTVSR